MHAIFPQWEELEEMEEAEGGNGVGGIEIHGEKRGEEQDAGKLCSFAAVIDAACSLLRGYINSSPCPSQISFEAVISTRTSPVYQFLPRSHNAFLYGRRWGNPSSSPSSSLTRCLELSLYLHLSGTCKLDSYPL